MFTKIKYKYKHAALWSGVFSLYDQAICSVFRAQKLIDTFITSQARDSKLTLINT